MKLKILLVDPEYKTPQAMFPPRGLMKISTYHKERGDEVRFVRGMDASALLTKWDRIYITTLFSFYWDTILDTIRFYQQATKSVHDVYVGGVMATLMHDELSAAVPVRVHKGPLRALDTDWTGPDIDVLPLDYDILSQIEYQYDFQNSYMAQATRGCPHKCSFCGVRTTEPEWCEYVPFKEQIQSYEKRWGVRKDIVFFDNNALASKKLPVIVQDLLDLGFGRGAVKMKGGRRKVDFNSGFDVRLLNEEHMKWLQKIFVYPFRTAFDDIRLASHYERAMKLATDYGYDFYSTLMLYNYKDTLEDFYNRCRIIINITESLTVKIQMFPMRYTPINAKKRKYVGEHWHPLILRGIQSMMAPSMGAVPLREDCFEYIFGKDYETFVENVVMPEDYRIHRKLRQAEIEAFRKDVKRLSMDERFEMLDIVTGAKQYTGDRKFAKLLPHYGPIERFKRPKTRATSCLFE